MGVGPLGGIRPGAGVTGAPNLPQGRAPVWILSPHRDQQWPRCVVPAVGVRHGPRVPQVRGWATDGTCPDAVKRIGYGQGSPMAKRTNRGRSSEPSARSRHSRERQVRDCAVAARPGMRTWRGEGHAHSSHVPARDDGDKDPQQGLPPRRRSTGGDGHARAWACTHRHRIPVTPAGAGCRHRVGGGPANAPAFDLEPHPSDRPRPHPGDRLGPHASDRPEP